MDYRERGFNQCRFTAQRILFAPGTPERFRGTELVTSRKFGVR